MVCITLRAPFVKGNRVALVDGRYITVQRLTTLLRLKKEQELLDLRSPSGELLYREVVCDAGGSSVQTRVCACIDVKKDLEFILRERLRWDEPLIKAAMEQIRNPLLCPHQPRSGKGGKEKDEAKDEPSVSSEEEEEEEEESSRSRKREREREREREDVSLDLFSLIKRIDNGVERALSLVGDQAVAAYTAMPEFEKRVKAEAEVRITAEMAALRPVREKDMMRDLAKWRAERERIMTLTLDKKREALERTLMNEAKANVAHKFNAGTAAAVTSQLMTTAAANGRKPDDLMDNIFTRLGK